jgi:hypothetical protein
VNPYVVYLDPNEDIDIQRARVRTYLRDCDGRAVEEHIGGQKAAMRSAQQLRVPFLSAKTLAPAVPKTEKPSILAKQKRAQQRYEEVRPMIRQAELLGLESLSQIAKYLTDRQVPMPSGKQGKWQPIQVKRALEWIGDVEK